MFNTGLGGKSGSIEIDLRPRCLLAPRPSAPKRARVAWDRARRCERKRGEIGFERRFVNQDVHSERALHTKAVWCKLPLGWRSGSTTNPCRVPALRN
jgi:hypothetical protein